MRENLWEEFCSKRANAILLEWSIERTLREYTLWLLRQPDMAERLAFARPAFEESVFPLCQAKAVCSACGESLCESGFDDADATRRLSAVVREHMETYHA